MSDEKPKPGRPRKWSSDAERMRAHRAAKREKPRADGERRAAAERDAAEKAKAAWSPAPSPEAPATNLTAEERSAIHGPCEAIIEQLREEVERLEAEFDEVVYDRWIVATQYRLAIHRMQEFDPPGLDWLDEQLTKWEARRDGYHEARWRARRSQRGSGP
jgi:hypothetical protein